MKTQEKTLDIFGAGQDFSDRAQKALSVKKVHKMDLIKIKNFSSK